MKVTRKQGWWFGTYVNYYVHKGKAKQRIRTTISGNKISLNITDVMAVARKFSFAERDIENKCREVSGYPWQFQTLLQR